MNILSLTTSFPNSPDDPTGFFVYQLVNAITSEGINIKVITPASNQKPALWQHSYSVCWFNYAPCKWQILAQQPGGIPVALKQNWINYLLVPSFLTSFGWNIIKFARKADIILANWAICGAIALYLFPFHHKPIVTVLRGSDVKIGANQSLINSFLLKKVLKGSEAVVCVGNELAIWLKDSKNYREKIYHIPNGIHEEFFKIGSPKPAHTHNILFVGSLIPRKGVDVLLKAIEKLKNLKICLFIVGEGPMKSKLMSLAQQLKIDHLIKFQGRIPPGKPMAEWMNIAHVIVLPSHHEGRPNVILEAMASGRPVIGSDIEGIRELVNQSKAGYLFPDGYASSLANTIQKFLEEPDNLHIMGQAARLWVIEQGLTWKNTARNYINLFLKIVS